ncbi:hypothetical protein GNX71_04675 [Variovorax sp. RKNM96]|uniref:hypothetical protein n=1 Tax=Variovorax sp. RKNM96 TaxID=2681552 RepID=UPI00197D7EEC|nr:hypothetical protein [Variovorax sp. RKNM96]QSI28910.1 hypothetical protein GNX71_04675 [Variovorax sp. RKNM96]
MMRKILVVGDPPALGGRVLSYGGATCELLGHRIALIGGNSKLNVFFRSKAAPIHQMEQPIHAVMGTGRTVLM